MNALNILTLTDLREKYAGICNHPITPNPRVLWAAGRFFRFISNELVVIGGYTHTHYQLLLSHIQKLTHAERQQLLSKFFDQPGGWVYSALLHQPSLPTISSEPSRVHADIWAVMLQLSLVKGDRILTFTQRFSDKFLQKAARRASVDAVTKRKESLGEIMQVKVRNSLKEILKREYGDAFVMPEHCFAVEYATPHDWQARGRECGFHLHGFIVATEESLPHIKEALYKAAECYDNPNGKRKRAGGYRQRGGNLAVHFGEPAHDFSNRGNSRKKCLSNAVNPVWANPKNYNFHWALYAGKDAGSTKSAARHKGINLGTSIFWLSPGLHKEAKASLGIFRLLMEYLPPIEKRVLLSV